MPPVLHQDSKGPRSGPRPEERHQVYFQPKSATEINEPLFVFSPWVSAASLSAEFYSGVFDWIIEFTAGPFSEQH